MQTKLQGITLDREKFALAQDLDRDGVNDANQRKTDELDAKKELEQMKLSESRRSKELELKVKEKELELKMQQDKLAEDREADRKERLDFEQKQKNTINSPRTMP